MFWRFSLRVYRAPGVEQACLALQDRCGADVNLMLLCGWLGQGGKTLTRRHLRQAMGLVAPWQGAVIAPLRGARRAIKQQPPPGIEPARVLLLRRRIGALERELEAIEQKLLIDLASGWPALARPMPARQAMVASLDRYLGLLPPGLSSVERDQLDCLADACIRHGATRTVQMRAHADAG